MIHCASCGTDFMGPGQPQTCQCQAIERKAREMSQRDFRLPEAAREAVQVAIEVLEVMKEMRITPKDVRLNREADALNAAHKYTVAEYLESLNSLLKQ